MTDFISNLQEKQRAEHEFKMTVYSFIQKQMQASIGSGRSNFVINSVDQKNEWNELLIPNEFKLDDFKPLTKEKRNKLFFEVLDQLEEFNLHYTLGENAGCDEKDEDNVRIIIIYW